MSLVEVRKAGIADVTAVVALERASISAPHWTERTYASSLHNDGDLLRGFYVAVRDGDVIGFVVGRVAAGIGEIESIAVCAAERRRGVGQMLIESMLAWCKGAGARVIELEVRAGGLAAQRLYGRSGFLAVGLRAKYYSDPEDDGVLMRWADPSEPPSAHV